MTGHGTPGGLRWSNSSPMRFVLLAGFAALAACNPRGGVPPMPQPVNRAIVRNGTSSRLAVFLTGSPNGPALALLMPGGSYEMALGTGVTQVPGFRATVDDPSAAPGRRTFVPCRYQRTEGDAAIVLCA